MRDVYKIESPDVPGVVMQNVSALGNTPPSHIIFHITRMLYTEVEPDGRCVFTPHHIAHCGNVWNAKDYTPNFPPRYVDFCQFSDGFRPAGWSFYPRWDVLQSAHEFVARERPT